MLIENVDPAVLQQARRLAAAEYLMPSVLVKCMWQSATIEDAMDSFVNELRIVFGEVRDEAPSRDEVFAFLDEVDRQFLGGCDGLE